MHHDGTHPDQPHQHDVLGKQRQRIVALSASESIPAVLDDNRLAGEASDVGQCLDQCGGA